MQLNRICAINQNALTVEWDHSSVSERRSLRALAISNPPFIDFDKQSSGIDMVILQTIANKLNLNIELSTIEHPSNSMPNKSCRFIQW